jgi:1-acyl-sn-glycerol-3-phosphate acyltransferase
MNDRERGTQPYGGWRVGLNRFIWRAFIFTMGPFVVGVERVLPNRGYGGRIASTAARLMSRMIGVRLEVRGLEKLDPRQAYVFTPNHRSHFDIAALIAALPGARFAGKKELFKEPALGAAMRALGMIPIDREDPSAARRTLDEAARKLGRKVSVVIFPEGTRAPAGQMLPFKGGAFVFAAQAQAPIVPVAVHNSAAVMPAHGYLSILGGRVVVEILDPIPTAGLGPDDRNDLKDQARKALVEALRPEDGGVAQRPDLGSFRSRAFGVRR